MIIKWRLLSFVLVILPQFLLARGDFSEYFINKTLRIDYLLGGTDQTAEVVIKQLKKEPYYGGSHVNLVEANTKGTYRYQLVDVATDEVIFSRGFCPIFQEWQATEEAKKQKGSFYQVAVCPFPKKICRFIIEQRNWEGVFEPVFKTEIDPDNYFILDEQVPDYEVENLLENGNPKTKVDVVILPEGYTADEMDKFLTDARRMLKALFETQPFKRHQKDFNWYAVKVPSVEAGTDIPGEYIYKNTAFNSHFYTFDTPRYLTTQDMLSIHDAASVVPYDHIYLLVNTDRYGGGGFYNFLSITSVDDPLAEKVFIHEFGHGFAGLADEYYTSGVAYSDYYNLEVEPWEANITTLVNFQSKWAELIDDATPQPTPRIAKYDDVVGLFEGGGYSEKGIYSPVMDCRMKSNGPKGFCPVCQQAIEQVIDWHCK
ncbi:M64 family metallopeptidase [uncultured Sunxiuqinia sp.]|uniref:M64 family metallopeptidase n=1 Tax=uncultured Sunxiuqinia sp. TaxID=1573825 RepID=UPI0026273A45|nr:M64 family metallopeptidase [uncultured Sunxiuqinia sp.]